MTTGCTFFECDFTEARFNASVHRNSAFVNCQFRGTNLFGARFDECKLMGSQLEKVNATGLIVSGGDWSYASLRHNNLKGVSLHKCRLIEADLYECNLTKADLREADLTRANLAKANLMEADLRGANVDEVDFQDVRLRGVRLDVVQAIAIVQSLGARIES